MKLIQFRKNLLNLLFPPNIKCLVCNKELNANTHFCLCDNCLKALPRNNKKTCYKCGEPIHSEANFCLHCKNNSQIYTRCFAPLLYKEPLTGLIKKFKYDNKRYLAETLGNFLVECYVLNNLNCDLVIPVPLYIQRFKKRGFNQAQLLAQQLKEKLNLPLYTDVLIRTKNTLTQTTLSKQQRQENVKKAFLVTNKKIIKNKSVLIIDDVYTTGSTINECAKALFAAGAREVIGVTLAHTFNESAL